MVYGGVFYSEKKQVLFAIHGLADEEEDRIGVTQYVYEIDVSKEVTFSYNNWYSNFTSSLSMDEWDQLPNYMRWLKIGEYYGWYDLDPNPREMNKSQSTKLIGGYRKR